MIYIYLTDIYLFSKVWKKILTALLPRFEAIKVKEKLLSSLNIDLNSETKELK